MNKIFIQRVSFTAAQLSNKTDDEIADMIATTLSSHYGDEYEVVDMPVATNTEVLIQGSQYYLAPDFVQGHNIWFQPTIMSHYVARSDSVLYYDPDTLLTDLVSRGSVFNRFVRYQNKSFVVFFIPKAKYDLLPATAVALMPLRGIVLGYWEVTGSGADGSGVRVWDYPLISGCKPLSRFNLPAGSSVDVTLGPQASMIDRSVSGGSTIAIATQTWSAVPETAILSTLRFTENARNYTISFRYSHPYTGAVIGDSKVFSDRSQLKFIATFNNVDKEAVSSSFPHCIGSALHLSEMDHAAAIGLAILSREGIQNTTAVVTSNVATLNDRIDDVADDLTSEAARLQQFTTDSVGVEAQRRQQGDETVYSQATAYATSADSTVLAEAKAYTDEHSGRDSGDMDSLYIRG